MILLDSCVVLDILFDEPDAASLSDFLDSEQTKGVDVVFLSLSLLETSSVTAVRHKEGKIPAGDLDDYLAKLATFQAITIADDLTQDLIAEAARIKSDHAASMVDCYLIANAIHRRAEILTADREIFSYNSRRAKVRKVTKRYAAIKWHA